jgi:Icc-related predicted phosphoesterase
MGRIEVRTRTGGAGGYLSILAVADQVSPVLYERFRPEPWRHVDLIISCGDLPPSYLDFLESNLDVPLLYVRGNHDGGYLASQYQGMTDLHGRIVTCRGLRIAGFEGSRRYNDGDVQYSDGEMRWSVMRTRFRALWGGPVDIVVSHAPPFGVHDAPDVCHRGFHALRSLIDTWHPSLLLHGHMHNYERAERDTLVGRTRVVQVFPFAVLQVPLAEERTIQTVRAV